MEALREIIQSFDPITLQEMDNVKLMDRRDTKYAFRQDELCVFLSQLRDSYRILEVDNHRLINYESLYFDTNNFELYNHHHCGRFNRYKIRYRKYVQSGLSFFEIKFKSNKGRTIKKRIRQNDIYEVIDNEAKIFFEKHCTINPQSLEAKMYIGFNRITLVNRNSPERVTIDLNLTFKNGSQKKEVQNLVIAEVKQDKSSRSEFIRLMKHFHIREGTISKYCLGISHLFTQLKNNNFKPQLIKFNKILYGTASGY
jgi:hypothetical protein